MGAFDTTASVSCPKLAGALALIGSGHSSPLAVRCRLWPAAPVPVVHYPVNRGSLPFFLPLAPMEKGSCRGDGFRSSHRLAPFECCARVAVDLYLRERAVHVRPRRLGAVDARPLSEFADGPLRRKSLSCPPASCS